MKPALTKEEWEGPWGNGIPAKVFRDEEWEEGDEDEEYACLDQSALYVMDGTGAQEICIGDELFHGVAALCLVNQEFGFTRKHVELLESEATMRGFMAFSSGDPPDGTSIDRMKQRELNSLADLVRALLPPK